MSERESIINDDGTETFFDESMLELLSEDERSEYAQLKRKERELEVVLTLLRKLKKLEDTAKRDTAMLMLRFKHDMTLEQIGERFGITRERVRQITDGALHQLKRHERRNAAIDLLKEIDSRRGINQWDSLTESEIERRKKEKLKAKKEGLGSE